MGTEFPPQKAVLAVTDNKKQLTQLIVDDLDANPWWFQSENRLVVTRIDPNVAPSLIFQGNVSKLKELRTFQEEADVIIIYQLLYAVEESGGKSLTTVM